MEKKTDFMNSTLALLVLTGSLAIAGCSKDENIDLNDVDSTIGIGADGFELPASSTNAIKLSDILTLNEGDCVQTLKADSGTYKKGDYQFKKGGDVNPARPKVKQFTFTQNNIDSQNIPFGITAEMYTDKISGLNKTYSLPTAAEGPAEIASFNFSDATGNAQILSLTEADITGGMDLDLRLTDIQSQVSQISLDIYIPKYFTFDETGKTVDKTTNPSYNIVKIINQPTSASYHLSLKLNKLENFQSTIPTGAESYVVVNPSIVQMLGKLKVQMHFTTNDIVAGAMPGMSNIRVENVDLGNEFVITHAEGYFNPDITINPDTINIGDDIPDFLTDNRVNIMLSNPTIKLEVDNNVDVEGLIKGVLVATYKDGKKRKLNVTKYQDIVMKRSSDQAKTTIVINRTGGSDPSVSYIKLNRATETVLPNDTIEVEDIAKLLSNIPEKIEFKFSANANTAKKGTIDLYKEGTEDDPNAKGCGYEIKPKYEFVAPLELEPGSTIVYNDTIGNWNEDLKDSDLELYEGKIIVSGNIYNGTPLMLNMKPSVVGVDKKPINGVSIKVVGSSNNTLSVDSHYGKPVGSVKSSFQLELSRNGGTFKDLDGLMFNVDATSKTKGTLNEDTQKIIIDGIKLKFDGKIAIKL